MSINLSDIAILNNKDADYCCIISTISKSETINLMQNTDMTEKIGTLQNMKIYYHIQKSNGISSGEKNCKYFIGYLYNNHKFKPLHIMLPKTSAGVKRYSGQTKWM